MLRIHKLSSEPKAFSPIEFQSGVNLILGERVEDSEVQGRKVNGVGKSLSVEFLHFALCRSFEQTRVSKIPEDVLPADLIVVLDATIGQTRLQIRRSISNHRQPEILMDDGTSTVMESLEEANRFLGELLFQGHPNSGQVSFRKIASLLMRDERSGFKSVVNPFDPMKRSVDDIAPHLYLLGIDLTVYKNLLLTIGELASRRKVLNELRREVTDGNNRKLKDVPQLLNEERQAAESIEQALSQLKAEPAFEKVENDLVRIESALRRLRAERKGISFRIDQIRSIPLPERIDAADMKIVYERIKTGLGELVEKSLEQAKEFKAEIERFQKSLREDDLRQLEVGRRELSSEIRKLSDQHAELTRQIDRKGVLGEITSGLQVAAKRADDYHRLATQFKLYEECNLSVEDAKSNRASVFNQLAKQLAQLDKKKKSLNDSIVAIHKEVQQSSRASFDFDLKKSPTAKRPLSIDVRIQDDGSESIDQVRVFIYDFALLFNEFSRSNHPGFLIHDNILEVDQDTLTRCLNFLDAKLKNEDDFQYILTLNRDRIASEEAQKDIQLDIESLRRASFTKANQFLGKRYQEL
jgi:uncharacterized protein YydD (DUF2326 family)